MIEFVIILLLLLLAGLWIATSKRIGELEQENSRLRALLSNAKSPEPPSVELSTLQTPLQTQPPVAPVDAESGPEWESAIGGSLLNKVGALVLVIGCALFLTYSYTRITPAGRAVISSALSLALLGAGILVERRAKYRVFARGLIGAGWAGLYATSYAIYALPATRVIADPFVGALLQLLVAGGMIAHSLRYRAEAITAVAYFSAFAALAATPSNSFAVTSLVPLAASVLYLAWRFEWHSTALFGVFATYATCIARGDSNAPFYASELLFLVFWMVFEGFDLLRVRARIVSVPLTLVFPVNALAFLALSGSAWSQHAPHELWELAVIMAILFSLSAFLRIWILATLSLSAMDIAARWQYGWYEAPLVFSAALAGFAIVERVPGIWATISLAAEAEVLYLAGVRFKSQFLRVLGGIGFTFSLGNLVRTGYRAPGNGFLLYTWTPAALLHALLFHVNRLIRRPNLLFSFLGSGLAALVIIAEIRAPYDALLLLAFSIVLLEVGLRGQLIEFRVQAYLGTATAVLLSHSEQFSAYAAFVWIAAACAALVSSRLTDRLVRSQIWAAISLLLIFAGSVTHQSFVAAIWGALLVVVLLVGKLRGWPDIEWQSLTIAALVFIRCVTVNLRDSNSAASLARFAATLTAALCLYAAQFLERGDRRYQTYFSTLATIVLTGLLYREVSGSLLTVAWGVAAVILLVGGFMARERILRVEGLALLLICILKLFLYDLRNLETMPRILSFIALGVLLLAVSWVYTRFRENINRFL